MDRPGGAVAIGLAVLTLVGCYDTSAEAECDREAERPPFTAYWGDATQACKHRPDAEAIVESTRSAAIATKQADDAKYDDYLDILGATQEAEGAATYEAVQEAAD